jgi:hypothetical protein
MTGLGTASIRWIPTDSKLRMDVHLLRRHIEATGRRGPTVHGGRNGGVRSTGAVDPRQT